MSDYFMGQVMMTGFPFAQRGFAQCNGALMSVTQNSALFSLLGNVYGGDGRT
ncbi:MAG: tail fiber protein, partial [Sphingomonas sp.]